MGIQLRLFRLPACLSAICLTASALTLQSPVSASAASAWLNRVNQYRASAGLPAVSESGSYDSGDAAHSQYMVVNQSLTHSETPGTPDYTAAGNAAGNQSDVMVDYTTATSDDRAIDLWMEGVFHAIGIVDPSLSQTGYGSYRNAQSGIQMGAALNVIAGRTGVPAGTAYPVAWPARGASIPLNSYEGGEYPDPLTSCSGYAAPTGPPIIVQLAPGSVLSVSAYSLSRDGAPLQLCEEDWTNYSNPDSGDQADGRALLGARQALALIPRSPLASGASYQVGLSVGGHSYSWSFSVNSGAAPVGGSPIAPVVAAVHQAPPAAAPRPVAYAPAPTRPAAVAARPSTPAAAPSQAAASVPSPAATASAPASPASGGEVALATGGPQPALTHLGAAGHPASGFRLSRTFLVALALQLLGVIAILAARLRTHGGR
jgi:uncharacterized protein YkwD